MDEITSVRQYRALSHLNGRLRALFIGYSEEEPVIVSDHLERNVEAPKWLRDWIRNNGFPAITEVAVGAYDKLPRPGQ